MTVQFRKRNAGSPEAFSESGRDGERTATGADAGTVRVAGAAELGEHLFDFLLTLRARRPMAAVPLVSDGVTVHALYDDPPPTLVEALRHVVDNLLVELGPDPAAWGACELSPAILGVALAAYLCVSPAVDATQPDPATEFGSALVATLTPARTRGEVLAYHAILQDPAAALRDLPPARAEILRRLVDLSPLTSVYHPHLYTPSRFDDLAGSLLRWWRARTDAPSPWGSLNEWLEALEPLLDRPAVASFLQRRWLEVVRDGDSCRNLGLLLEALRRRGRYRAFLFEFFAAYDWLHGEPGVKYRRWRLLDEEVEPRLRAGADRRIDEMACRRINQRGHEYFLLFYPLLRAVKEEGRLPSDCLVLTVEFVTRLDELARWTRYRDGNRPSVALGTAAFESDDQP